MSSVPDYYKILGVSPTATPAEIKAAYKKAALRTHPDRVPASDAALRAQRTREFQRVNDAFHYLSDPIRRREYDDARRYSSSANSGSSWFHTASNNNEGSDSDSDWQDEQFGNIFEEMLREEGMAGETAAPQGGSGRLYGILGGVSGAALGFIMANVPGMLAGAVAGNRLGAIRDTKGKSVYEVFQQLPASDRAKVLADLAAKVLSSAVSA